MPNTYEFINNRKDLIKVRKQLGMSQEKFGKLCGVSRQAVSYLEEGRTKLTEHKLKFLNLLVADYIKKNKLKLRQEVIFVYKKGR